jgi:hypothetical protein
MVDDIAAALEALASDSARRPIHPVSAIRRRGDRRRTTVRVAATAGTVVFVGATAGTAYAVATLPSAGHGGSVGFANSPGHHDSHQSQLTKDTSAEPSPAPSDSILPSGVATPTPSPGDATASAPAQPPAGANTNPPSPLASTPPSPGAGTAQPIASPTPTAS